MEDKFNPSLYSIIQPYISDSQLPIMSFFPLQPRDIDKYPPNDNKVGPGYYLSQTHSAQKQGYAPFGSLSPKKKTKTMQSTLGPGQYKIDRELLHPSINKYQNKNIIIVKINDDGGHQFKSRTNRFPQTKGVDVGPGSYEAEIPLKKIRSTSVQPSKVAQKVRQLNRQYYREQRQVTLLSDPLETQSCNDLKEREKVKTKGVLNWSLNQRQRFKTDVKQEYTTQEKQRALSEIIASRKKKVKPSAVFMSKSMKSHIQSHIYKTNNPFKAELRKMIDFKDEQPGPGTYEVNRQKNNSTSNKFQFFGSTVERFPEGKKNQVSIGPGSYKLQGKKETEKTQTFQLFDKPEKEDRYSYLPSNLYENPGPGSYYSDSLVRPRSQEKQLKKPFGSRQPRFPAEKGDGDFADNESFQMTVYYKEKQEKKEAELKMRKMMLQSHGTPPFVSAAKRFQETKQEQPQIGTYDVGQSDIAARMVRYTQMAKQFEECQLKKPAFMSSEQRFKFQKQEENQHKDCWCLVKSVEKQMLEHQSPSFACGERREIFETKASVPPVGSYENRGEGMIRDSFNSRFRKKAENQIKKSNVIRPPMVVQKRNEVYVANDKTSVVKVLE